MTKMIVISSAPLISENHTYSAYSPYAKEMEVWARHAGEIGFLCPVLDSGRGMLLSEFSFPVVKVFAAKGFDVKSFSGLLKAVRYSAFNFVQIYKAMSWADHIHLRCPGNISLMGCIMQMFFPHKKKTAKYAGNWDPKAKQPLSYKIQKWILNNTFLTRNMQALVYGEWEGSSRNIKPFFTATYYESDKFPVAARTLDGTIRFLFVGTLSEGKRPLYAIQLLEALRLQGIDAALELYGDGKELDALVSYVHDKALGLFVIFKGNQPESNVRQAYCNSHFSILPSKSEGWPKAIAEAMFWGCCPVATPVSCVPYMIGHGSRGVLLELQLAEDVRQLARLITDQQQYNAKVADGIVWSRQFTLDLFENEIKHLLTS